MHGEGTFSTKSITLIHLSRQTYAKLTFFKNIIKKFKEAQLEQIHYVKKKKTMIL